MKKFEYLDEKKKIAEDDGFVIIYDSFPVSDGHCLIISKSGAQRFSDLSEPETYTLIKWIRWTTNFLNKTLSPKPDGYNFGLNDGEAAGQTMRQLHFHIIPRYNGDCEDPRGGIRHIFPDKAKYW